MPNFNFCKAPRLAGLSIFLSAVVILVGFLGFGPVAAHQESSTPIGTATQDADGTINLTLRATSSGGAIGDALVRYDPTDPNYNNVKQHIGDIPEHQSVPVQPFNGKFAQAGSGDSEAIVDTNTAIMRENKATSTRMHKYQAENPEKFSDLKHKCEQKNGESTDAESLRLNYKCMEINW